MKETVVCEATIFTRMFETQSLAKNFNVKGSAITEVIGMWLPYKCLGLSQLVYCAHLM